VLTDIRALMDYFSVCVTNINNLYFTISTLEKENNNMSCIASRKILSPMYLVCDVTVHTLIYCGGIKIDFSIFIFLSAYYKYKRYKNILILLKDKWV
jgi:hypothetical protein